MSSTPEQEPVERAMEPEQPESNPSRRWLTKKRFGAYVAAAALAVSSAKVLNLYGEPGAIIVDQPDPGAQSDIDSTVRIESWNMHMSLDTHLDDVKEIIETREPDVIAMQEVLQRHYERLADRLPPEWGGFFMTADPNTKPGRGSFGNVILAEQRIEDIHRDVIEGTSPSESLFRVIQGREKEEDRGIMVHTIRVLDADTGQERDLKVVNAHITGSSLHSEQLEKVIEFIKDQLDRDTPLVFAGDLNGYPDEIRDAFLEIGMWVPEPDRETYEPGRRQADYFALFPAAVLGIPEVQLLKEFRTDHYLQEMTVGTAGWNGE